jgi:hypothetical protein
VKSLKVIIEGLTYQNFYLNRHEGMVGTTNFRALTKKNTGAI